MLNSRYWLLLSPLNCCTRGGASLYIFLLSFCDPLRKTLSRAHHWLYCWEPVRGASLLWHLSFWISPQGGPPSCDTGCLLKGQKYTDKIGFYVRMVNVILFRNLCCCFFKKKCIYVLFLGFNFCKSSRALFLTLERWNINGTNKQIWHASMGSMWDSFAPPFHVPPKHSTHFDSGSVASVEGYTVFV